MNALSESITNKLGPSPGASIPARPDFLSHTTAFWLLVALVGQWAFLYYISAFYGVSIFSGTFEVWNRFEAFGRTLYVAGDTIGKRDLRCTRIGRRYRRTRRWPSAHSVDPQTRARLGHAPISSYLSRYSWARSASTHIYM